MIHLADAPGTKERTIKGICLFVLAAIQVELLVELLKDFEAFAGLLRIAQGERAEQGI